MVFCETLLMEIGEKRPSTGEETSSDEVSKTMKTSNTTTPTDENITTTPTDENIDDNITSTDQVNAFVQFCSESGEAAGPPIELPLSLGRDKLKLILNTLLKKEETTPYSFFVDEKEIKGSLKSEVDLTFNEEKILNIVYQPQAVFRVRAVTRCTSSLPGHAEAILHATFSPDGQYLASGSGDTTVRFWDVNTETPHFTCKGHKHWVLVTAWSPDGERLASACKAGHILIWNPSTGKQIGRSLIGHKQWVTAMCWEPLHLTHDGVATRLASAGKDGDVRIWNTKVGTCEKILSNHMKSATALRWGGDGLIYSASQDRTIKVWRSDDGVLCRTLLGHAHWVNTLALSTDYVLRTGPFDPQNLMKASPEYTCLENRKSVALKRYTEAVSVGGQERLVSGSDDFTLFLWEPSKDKRPIERMTGHQQLINDVKFSPDTRTVASASFDKSIRLWNGFNGKFICVLRGHVSGVYQIAWSADSRLLVSGSKDSTLKVWSMNTKKLDIDLPGHADEVYAVDWSPDGQRVVSGGKDKVMKLWRR